MHVACNLSFIVKMKEFSRSSSVTFTSKSGTISGTELDRDTVTTGHYQDVIYSLRKCSNYDDLRRINFKVICRLQSFSNGMFCSCKICTDKRISRSLCNSRASCDTIPECDRQTHDDGIYRA